MLIVLYGLGSKLHAPPPEGDGVGVDALTAFKVLVEVVEVPFRFFAVQTSVYVPASGSNVDVDGIVQLVAPPAAPPEP